MLGFASFESSIWLTISLFSSFEMCAHHGLCGYMFQHHYTFLWDRSPPSNWLAELMILIVGQSPKHSALQYLCSKVPKVFTSIWKPWYASLKLCYSLFGWTFLRCKSFIPNFEMKCGFSAFIVLFFMSKGANWYRKQPNNQTFHTKNSVLRCRARFASTENRMY